MNLLLKNRVGLSFFIANLAILLLTFMVFNFLNSLSTDISNTIEEFDDISLKTENVRVTAISILKQQRKILTESPTPELLEEIANLAEQFNIQLQNLEVRYKDPNGKKIIAQMLSYVDSLKVVLSKTSLFHRDSLGLASIGELFDKILDSFSQFQDVHFFQKKDRASEFQAIISEVKKNMMITLIIGFLATLLLGLVVPGKIALPFKKIKDAIRELQECNFDVSIYYGQSDEIGEIAREMNKMIHSFKVFEELRADRISVEKRKFDVLANMMKRPVLVANASGKLIYINNQLYSLLQVQTEDVIGKDMNDSIVPSTIIETYELAIKRRSKIENAEIVIDAKKSEVVEEKKESSKEAEKEDSGEDERPVISDAPPVFKGYANVIPIRGKESSLDYYLMILSTEVFT